MGMGSRCPVVGIVRRDFGGVCGHVRFSPFTGRYFYEDRNSTGTGVSGCNLSECLEALRSSVYWSKYAKFVEVCR